MRTKVEIAEAQTNSERLIMMNALGMCEHNNLGSYCPFCHIKKEKTMGARSYYGMGRRYNQMGLDLSSLLSSTGSTLSNDVNAIIPSLEASAAQSLLSDPTVQAQATQAAAQGFATKLYVKFQTNPLLYGAIAVAVVGVVGYGIMKALEK